MSLSDWCAWLKLPLWLDKKKPCQGCPIKTTDHGHCEGYCLMEADDAS